MCGGAAGMQAGAEAQEAPGPSPTRPPPAVLLPLLASGDMYCTCTYVLVVLCIAKCRVRLLIDLLNGGSRPIHRAPAEKLVSCSVTSPARNGNRQTRKGISNG
jgi:hypothetical protein